MLIFEERGKPEYPLAEKNHSVQSREPTNSTHIWRRVWESSPGHTGGRWVPSPRRHPCTAVTQSLLSLLYFIFSPQEYILKGVVNAALGQEQGSVSVFSIISTWRFWDGDGNRKWSVFPFSLSSHYHMIYIVQCKYHFTSRDESFEIPGETAVLACEMFTSGSRPWLKIVGCLSSLMYSVLWWSFGYFADILRGESLCYENRIGRIVSDAEAVALINTIKMVECFSWYKLESWRKELC